MNAKIDCYLRTFNAHTRPNASHGLWMIFLISVCLSVCVLRHPTSTIFELITIFSLVLSCNALFIVLTANINNCLKNYLIISPNIAMIPVIDILFGYDYVFAIIIGISMYFTFKYGLIYVLRKCPLSFTFGEAVFALQSVLIFILATILNVIKCYNEPPIAEHDIITLILQVGMFSVLLIVATVHKSRSDMYLQKFIGIVITYFILMILALHILLERSVLLWMLNFITSDKQKLMMVGFWVVTLITGISIVSLQIYSGDKASTSHRKIFHILSAGVYIPGVMYECNLIYLASGIALGGIIALETIRKSNIGWFSTTLNYGFSVFADEKDVGGISMTPIYLLLGISGPIFLHPSHCEAVLPLFSGILSVGVGDAAASYFGSRYGRKKWPGSAKSYMGTLANIASQFFVLFLFHEFGYIEVDNFLIVLYVIAVMINSFVEALSDQVDNITLPIITFSILMLA